MTTITASQVKELRERTGVGLMECKKALSENSGDIEKAIQYLREKGLSKAAKKADRSTNEGKVFVATNSDNTVGLILEINCETDFVANNDDFISFGETIATHLLNTDSLESVEALEGTQINGKNFTELSGEYVLKLGENIKVKQFTRISAKYIGSYTHMTGKMGAIVGFSGSIDPEIAKDIAMHTTAVNPQYLKREDVSTQDLENEKTILKTQAINEGKPAEVVEKIVSGKINKYYSEHCLLEQFFVKDDKKTIKSLLEKDITITHFTRYQLG